MQKYLSVFEKILFWQVITLLVFIPLYFKFPLVGVTGTFVSIRLEDILIGITAFTWLGYILISGQYKNFIKNPIYLCMLIFFFVGVVSLLSAVYLTHTATPSVGFLHLLRRVELLILFPIAATVFKTREQVRLFVMVLVMVTIVACFYGIGQRYLNFPAVSTTNSELSKGTVYFVSKADRISSTFAGHYDLAVFTMISIAVTFPFLFCLKRKKVILSLLATNLVGGVVLVMTAARLSFVAAIVAVVWSVVLLKKKKLILAVIAVALIALIYPSSLRDRLVSTFTVNIQRSWTSFTTQNKDQLRRSQLNIYTLPAFRNEFLGDRSESVDIAPGEPTDSTDLGVYRSFDIRTQVEWPRAIRALVKNPLLGTGYSSLGLATDNDLLRSLGEVGILGSMAFILLMLGIIKYFWKHYKASSGFGFYLYIGVLTLILGFIINSLFIDVFEASKVASIFWLIIGVGYGYEKV